MIKSTELKKLRKQLEIQTELKANYLIWQQKLKECDANPAENTSRTGTYASKYMFHSQNH
jgi:hypothetical protein